MLKKIGLYSLMLLASCAVHAQLVDSISVNTNSFHQNLQQELYGQPLWHSTSKLDDYTETRLHYQHKDLGLKRVQTPETTNSYQFVTEGIFNFSEELRLFGSFRYTKFFEKGLGYNLSAERTEQQAVLPPNYFFAPKKGDWKNDLFEIKGGFSYQLPANFLVGGIFYYKNRSAYRILDPRPKIKIADYAVELHGGYRFQNHSLFIKGGLGRKTTTAGIMYVDESKNAPVFTETFTRFSTGYGRVVFNSSYSDYLRKTLPKTFGAGYSFQQKNQRFFIWYDYQKGIENFYSEDANNGVYFREDRITYKYRKITHKIALGYYRDGTYWDYRLWLGHKSEEGDNYSVVDRGQNYRHTLKNYYAIAGVLKTKNKRILLAVNVKGNYATKKYVDLLGYTDKRIDVFQLETRLNRDLWNQEHYTFNLGLHANISLPLDENLITQWVSNDTSFLENVIVPDHAYDVSTKLTSGIMANFTFKLSGSKELRFFAAYNRISLLDDAYKNYYPLLAAHYGQYIDTGIVISF